MTAMTAQVGSGVVHLTTFTPEEIATVLDALKLAQATYHGMDQGLSGIPPAFHRQLVRQASEAGELRLRIEASL